MVCIYCHSPTQVVNSRLQRRTNHIWRRRRCSGCGALFTTEEHATLGPSLMVVKSKDHLVPFSRDILFISIHDSCRHRATSIDDAGALTQTVLGKLLKERLDGTIDRKTIIETVTTTLKRFDAAAAAVYSAYHP